MIAKNGDAIAPETWNLLYGQAEKLRLMQPWKRLSDTDLFGIEDAERGQTVWFSVMGSLREVFALAIYVGDAGLDYFLQIVSGQWVLNPPDQIVLGVNCMGLEFVPKSELTKIDEETIKAAVFTPPARAKVAQFRSTQKGFGPWYLDADEAALLTRVLPGAVEIIGILSKDKQFLKKARTNGTPPYYTKGKNGEWQLQWRDLSAEVVDEPENTFIFSELEAAEIKISAKRTESEWQIGFTMLGGMIAEENQRPYPAGAFLCMDMTADQVFNPVMYQPDISQGTLAAQTLLEAIRYCGEIPAVVISEEAEWLDGMLPIADALGIELYDGETPMIREFGAVLRKGL